MTSRFKNPPRFHLHSVLLLTLLLLAASSRLAAQSESASETVHSAPHDALTDAAFDHFYNMEYDKSLAEFEKEVDTHPGDCFALNHLLTAVLMRNLYETGGMNTGDYSNDSFIGHAPRPTSQKVKDRIKDLVKRAEAIEEEKLKANSKDIDTLYCRGVTRAQYAVYTGLVERAWFTALRNAVGARHDHEHVLEIDPSYLDAKLVVARTTMLWEICRGA